MQRIDATAAEAEDVLVWLGRHVPVGIDLGTPKIIIGTGKGSVLTADGDSTALISLAEDSASVTRMAELRGGRVEITSWSYGEETARTIIPLTGGGGGGGGDGPDEPQPYDGPPGGPADPEFAVIPVRTIAG